MSDYFPPGVTGNEPQIAGPISEGTELSTETCPECGFSGEVEVSQTQWERYVVDVEWTCPNCGAVQTDEMTIDDDYFEEWG